MITIYLKRIGWFIGLVLLQALILNNVHIAGYATPFLYIYLIIKLPSSTSRNELLLWGFSIGLCIDVFSNTPGMNAAAGTFLAFLRPLFLRLFSPRDGSDDIIPSVKTIGMFSFVKYIVTCVLFHHAFLFLIESFSLFDAVNLLIRIGTSVVFTVLCIMSLEGFKK